MLVTVELELKKIHRELSELRLRLDRVERYAENTNGKLHGHVYGQSGGRHGAPQATHPHPHD